GTMAQIGRGAAVVELPGGETLKGSIAWLAWLGVHLSLLSGAEEKTSVFVDWGWNLITHKRSKRMVLNDTDNKDTPAKEVHTAAHVAAGCDLPCPCVGSMPCDLLASRASIMLRIPPAHTSSIPRIDSKSNSLCHTIHPMSPEKITTE